MQKDTLYATPLHDPVAAFVFDENVVSVFPDMINRSVPAYSHVIAMTGVLGSYFAQENTNVYDLGCSLGATTLAMYQNIKSENITFIGIDNSPSMIEKASEILTAFNIKLICGDIQTKKIENASVVAMNFTLQFVPIEERLSLLKHIYAGMLPNSALIVSEKIAFVEAEKQDLFTELHHHFKRTNGYSNLEIAQKRNALENVMIPESLQTHLSRFRQAGFEQVEIWFQSLNFVSFLAKK